MKSWFLATFGLTMVVCSSAIAQPTPAERISTYRLQHSEGRVTLDPILNKIAQEQATAMAAKDELDHSVLGPFSSRVAPARSASAAENIAYGYDTFEKTLDLWIESTGHRKNLLLHQASRVGIASAKNPKSGRTYWAMVIAVPAPPPRPAAKHVAHPQTCRLTILNLCL